VRALVQHRVRKGEPPGPGTRAQHGREPASGPGRRAESTCPPDSSVAWEPEFLTSVHTQCVTDFPGPHMVHRQRSF